MKPTISATWILLVVFFFLADCFGFSSSSPFGISGSRQRPISSIPRLPQKHPPLPTAYPTIAKREQKGSYRAFILQQTASNEGSSAVNQRKVPYFVYKLNASTKWLVLVACTLGVWTRIHHYEGPFVIVGSILATYFTDALKKLLNQGRPDGAPIADPGMPSSHSLVSFFLAVAWSTLVLPNSPISSGLLLASASVISLLRVICGYHSWAQIVVGTALGVGMGSSWAKLGSFVATHGHPIAVFRASWTVYLLGSAFYIIKTIRPWLYEDKHL